MHRLGALVALAACALPAQPVAAPKLRLPDGVRPLSYDLELWLTPGQDDFSGRVVIDLEARAASSVLWLHAKELTFRKVLAGGAPANAQPAQNDFVGITPGRPLGPGRTTISIEYQGKVSRLRTDGVFQQQDGGDWYVFSQFEPVAARRAFPCFDEPSFKTPWKLTLHVPANLSAFANTPVTGETVAPDGTKTLRFARSRRLPSYLVAFAVGPFETVPLAPVGRRRVPSRVIVPRGRTAEAGYAASVTGKALQLLEDFFGTPYPYEKLDQVVVPVTTNWGAMENPGLITYGQFLLASPGKDSVGLQQERLFAIIHEISHQWFGNLVTPSWWTDIWLNEAFANWITAKILDQWHPEWKTRLLAVKLTNEALRTDALVAARKVRQPIENPDDIYNALDEITYQKGAALLVMLEQWLGESAFRKGVLRYLARHAGGNAATPDFLNALGKVSGRDVSQAASSFLDQRGAPLVRADVRCSGGHPVLRLTQERFVPIGSKGSPAAVWKFPVCVRWSDGKAERRDCAFLDQPAAEFPLRNADACPAWLLVNDGAMGYYRYAYEGAWFDRLLASGLAHIARSEESALLQNVEALLTGGKFDPSSAFSLAMRMGSSEDSETVLACLRICNGIFFGFPDELQPAYARMLRAWLGERARALGWRPKPGESEDTRTIRSAIVPMVAAPGEDVELADEARRLAGRWLRDRKALDAEVVSSVLSVAARGSDRDFFDQLADSIRSTADQAERQNIIRALTAIRDPGIFRSALDLILNPGPGIEPRELQPLLQGNWRGTRPIVWEFVQRNFDKLHALLPGALGLPDSGTLPAVAAKFCDESRAREVESFFKPRIASIDGGARDLARMLERIRLCSARREALEGSVRAILARY